MYNVINFIKVGAPLARSCYELVDHPCSGFGFELTSATAECARYENN